MEKRTKTELLARLTEAKARVTAINEQYEGHFIDPQSQDGTEWNALNAEIDDTTKTVTQMEAREARIAELAKNPANTSEGAEFLTRRPGAVTGSDIYDLSTVRTSVSSPEQARHELHERAQRAIEVAHFPHERADQAGCKESVDRILASVDDASGTIAKRILVTGNPAYKRAFAQAVRNPGALSTPEFSAALSLGTDADGGFAVPFELDPTIIPTSDGAVNPYRAIGRVVQITGKEYDVVTSDGVTAHRGNEADEASDDAPTLSQPTVRAERVDVFIPFSIELEQDWGGMQTELARMITDAKDLEEATAFTTGNGTAPNAQGIVTGATITDNTAGTATLALADLDTLENDLPSRFQGRARYLGNRSIYTVFRALTQAVYDPYSPIHEGINQGGTGPLGSPDGNMRRTLHGYPAHEASAMTKTHTSGQKVLVLGDFGYFLIIDRLGMSMELIPHLFGSNRRPTGQRGFFAVWRNNSHVVSAKAFRTLVAL